MPDSIKDLEGEAFGSCTGLKEVTVPGDAYYGYYRNYSDGPFNQCPIEKVTFTKGRTGAVSGYGDGRQISWTAESTLREVVFAEGVTEIGNHALSGSGATEEDGTYVAGIESITWAETLKKIGSQAFAFQDNLTEVHLPEGVTEMDTGVFENCNGLTYLDDSFAPGMTAIPVSCFRNCKGFRNVFIPSNIEMVSPEAFMGCENIEDLTVPASTTNIKARAFYGCVKLEEVTLPDSIKDLEGEAFGSCTGLKEVTVPGDAYYGYYRNYSDGPFNQCPIEKVTFTKGRTGAVSGYGDGRQISWTAESTLREVVFAEGVTEIGNHALSGSGATEEDGTYVAGITTITWPSTLEKIGYRAFANQDDLMEVCLSESVINIGSYAFSNCDKLAAILIPNTNTQIESTAVPSRETLTVFGLKGSYAEAYAGTNSNPFIALYYPYVEVENEKMVPEMTQQLKATVYTGINETSTNVIWRITGNTDENTAITTDGILTIAEDEQAEIITAIATWAENTSEVEITILRKFYTITYTMSLS